MSKLIGKIKYPASGDSAYQVAVNNGFVGTEEEWIASLNGNDGKSAYEIWLEQGNTGTEQEFLESLNGKDGSNGLDGKDGYTPIKGVDYFDGKNGKDGVDGKNGTNGVDGKDGTNGADGKNYVVDIVESVSSTQEIQPNKFYKFGELTELNITLANPTDTTILNEYMFEFISGNTATTLIIPDTIKWLETPNIEANKTYQCSIVNNIGILVGVENV
jgi:hypothetical protein